MLTNDNPVRRGDYVAFEHKHSSTHLRSGPTYYSEWHVIRVSSIDRNGYIRRAYLTPDDADRKQSYEIGYWEIATVPDHQARAAEIFAADAYFESADTIKAAFKAGTIKEALALAKRKKE